MYTTEFNPPLLTRKWYFPFSILSILSNKKRGKKTALTRKWYFPHGQMVLSHEKDSLISLNLWKKNESSFTPVSENVRKLKVLIINIKAWKLSVILNIRLLFIVFYNSPTIEIIVILYTIVFFFFLAKEKWCSLPWDQVTKHNKLSSHGSST